MPQSHVSLDENTRITWLHELSVLDTSLEVRFDRITRMAKRLFDVPIARVDLLDAAGQWVNIGQPQPALTAARPKLFCDQAIAQNALLVIPDTLADPRFAREPVVTSAPNIRFYAGQPLCGPDGGLVGTLCIIDHRPRAFNDADLRELRDLAYWAERELQSVQLPHALARLSGSEQRFSSVIAALHEGILVQNAEGRILVSNASAESLLCFSPNHMFGRGSDGSCLRIIREDGMPFPTGAHPAIVTLQTGKPCKNVVMGLYRPDGRLIWLSLNTQPMFATGAAKPHSVVTSFVDITEQKEAEHSLRAAELRFRTLVEKLPVITYIAAIDQNSSTIYTSPQIETLLGFSQAEWMADHQHWLVQIHPDDRERVLSEIAESHATGVMPPSEYRMLTRAGAVKWFRDVAVIVHDEAGEPLFLQGMMFDITERKLAEEALHQSEQRNRALVNAIPDMMFRITKAGVLLDFNTSYASDLALPPDNLIGRSLAEALPAPIAGQLLDSIGLALSTGVIQIVEYALHLDGDERDFEARIVPSGENETLAIVRDITERKNIERLKNEFVSTVSHELRTPLTSIRGSLGLIAGGVAGPISERASTMVDIAYKNSERLVRLINDILDIEKIESGKLAFNLKPIEIAPLVEQAVEANRAYGKQFDVGFVLANDAAGAWVNADSDRLTQAITNLLSNAAKFSPPHDSVLVSATRVAGAIRVAISDHGAGIPEAFRARMFQKFAQADASDTRQKGGTGLGLSITKAIVEKHDGQIDYETAPMGGTTFFLDLPEWPTAAPIHIGAGAAPATRVLICEDDYDVARLLGMMLQQAGFSADLAHTAAHARQLLALHRYSALTLDITLPGQDGISFIRELRAQAATRDLPIVVISASARPAPHELQGPALSVVDWLIKPIDQARLISAIKRMTPTSSGD